MLPFVVNHLLVAQPSVYWSPAHVFLVLRLFCFAARGNRPATDSLEHAYRGVHDRGGAHSRVFGSLLALLKWASMMKQFILYTIFCNVLTLPWGLSQRVRLGCTGCCGRAFPAHAAGCLIVVRSRRRNPACASFVIRSPCGIVHLACCDRRQHRNPLRSRHAAAHSVRSPHPSSA